MRSRSRHPEPRRRSAEEPRENREEQNLEETTGSSRDAQKELTREKTALSGSGKGSSPTWIATIAPLGVELNLSERRIYQLLHEGLPRISPGRYDVVACCRWYVRFLQRKILERAQPREGDGTAAAGVTKNKLLAIQSELASIELAEKREGLISVEKVRKDIQAIIREIRRRFGALPPKLAAEILAESDLAVAQVKIDRSLKSALEALSEFDPDGAICSRSTQPRTEQT
jgi:hypothetical protein